MRILIKFIFKSAWERKARTLLILLSVALSASLFFSASSLTENLVDKYEQNLRSKIGNADIMISEGQDSPSPYFTPKLAETAISNNVDYIVPVIDIIGTYKLNNKDKETVSLIGMDFEDYKKTNELVILKTLEEGLETAAPVIVSENCLNKYGFKLGDTIELTVEGNRKKYQIAQIAARLGKFADEISGVVMITPYKALSESVNQKGKANTVYIKMNNKENVTTAIRDLEKYYSRYDVKEPFLDDLIKMQLNLIASPLMLMSGLVTLMSIFIIYSSFKVIMIEKLPSLGTFRSIGADKKMINKVMFLESLFYGMLGGILACLGGMGILFVLTAATMPADVKEISGVQLDISIAKLLFTFIFANLVCFGSSIFPIMKISNMPIKDIVLNTVNDGHSKKKRKKEITGFLLIALGLIVNKVFEDKISLSISALCLVMCIIGFIKVIPIIMKGLSGTIGIISQVCFGNIGILAAKNTRNNKSINNSISLIAIGIAILFFVSTLGYSVGELLTSTYDNANYNVTMMANSMDINTLKSIKANSNVKDARGVYFRMGTTLKDKNKSIGLMTSANGVKALGYMDYLMEGNEEEIFEKLQNGRNAVIGSFAAQNLGVSVGDTMTLELENGDKTYTVVGISNAALNMRNFALIGDIYFKKDIGREFFDEIDIISNNPEATKEILKENHRKLNPQIKDKEELIAQEKGMIDTILGMISAFAALALLIGVVGIINNLLISFIERKRSLAVLRSIGLCKKDMIKMVFIEALLSGLMGGVLGICGGVLICHIMPSLMNSIQVSIPFIYNRSTFTNYLMGGILVTVLATIIPAMKTSKLNIIEAIKFE